MSELSDAKAIAAARRAHLLLTARAVQAQLQPKVLAGNAIGQAKRKGEAMAEDAVHALRSRPRTLSAVVAGATALLSFKLFRRFQRRDQDGDDR